MSNLTQCDLKLPEHMESQNHHSSSHSGLHELGLLSIEEEKKKAHCNLIRQAHFVDSFSNEQIIKTRSM